MMRKATILGVLAVLLGIALATPGDSSAHHYTYMQENPNDRETWSGDYPFNATYLNWAYGTGDTLWADDGSFTPRIRAAIET